MLYMKLFLLNVNDFTINEKCFRLRGQSTKKLRAEIIWFGFSPRGDFKLKMTLSRGLKVNG